MFMSTNEKWGISIALIVVVLLFFLLVTAEGKRRLYMQEKCTPDPSQWECQVYLAEKGQQAIRSSATSGAMIGGMIGAGMRK